MKVLVLGSGQVAGAVRALAPASAELTALARRDLDITDAQAIKSAVARVRPAWIINAAAYTAVDLAEDESEKAHAVNDVAVRSLAEAAAESGARLLHLSTDYVFDGSSCRAYRPSDPTRPQSVYGASKLAGERHLANSSGVVIRTSWVYAAQGKNFVLTMLRLMREKPRLSVVADQIGSPTYAPGLAAAIWRMLGIGAPPGMYHWSDLGIASWYDFAVAIAEEASARGLLQRMVPIEPIGTAQYPTRAKRPAFSALDSSQTRALLEIETHHWRQNLRMMLDELRTQ